MNDIFLWDLRPLSHVSGAGGRDTWCAPAPGSLSARHESTENICAYLGSAYACCFAYFFFHVDVFMYVLLRIARSCACFCVFDFFFFFLVLVILNSLYYEIIETQRGLSALSFLARWIFEFCPEHCPSNRSIHSADAW